MAISSYESHEEAVAKRLHQVAKRGCLQAKRMLYGLKPCFDDLIVDMIELEYLTIFDLVDPELPGGTQHPDYAAPSCQFIIELQSSLWPMTTIDGIVNLAPGFSYGALLTALFTQADAGNPIAVEFTKNGMTYTTGVVDTPVSKLIGSGEEGLFEFGSKISFLEGPIKNNPQGDPDPTGHIESGTVACGNYPIRFRYPVYWGVSNDLNIVVSTGNNFITDDLTKIEIPWSNVGSPGYFWFAVPAQADLYNHWYQAVNNQGYIGQSVSDFMRTLLPPGLSDWYDLGDGNIQNYRIYVSDYPTEGDGIYIMTIPNVDPI